MSESEEEGLYKLTVQFFLHGGDCTLADDFIVDEMGRPINRKKGGDQNTDMYVANCDMLVLRELFCVCVWGGGG